MPSIPNKRTWIVASTRALLRWPMLADCNLKRIRAESYQKLGGRRQEAAAILLRPIDDVAGDDGRHHLAVQLAAAKRRVLGFGERALGVVGPTLGRVEDGDIGMRA